MKYCSTCGSENKDTAIICTNCGAALDMSDVPSIGLNILAFMVPVLAIIFYIVYHQKAPKKTKAICGCAILGFLLSLFTFIPLLL